MEHEANLKLFMLTDYNTKHYQIFRGDKNTLQVGANPTDNPVSNGEVLSSEDAKIEVNDGV